MNCDPKELAVASKCFCFNKEQARSVKIYLLCQWASGGSPPCPLPTAPVDLGASAGNGQVTLTWPAGVGATGYNIKRALVTGGPYTTIDTSAGSPYVDHTVVNGTQYFYVVSSTNACGESVGNSIESHATPVAPPAGVTNLTAVYASGTQINLAWTDNATNETEYRIYRSDNGGAYALYDTIAAGSVAYNDVAATASHIYAYKVAPANAGGETLSGAVTPTVASFIATTTGAQTLNIAALTVTANMVVDWGDGNQNTYNGAGARSHNYAGAGTWTVRFLSPLLVTTLNLSDNKITLNSAQIAPILNVTDFRLITAKAGTLNSSDISAWTPTTFQLVAMPAGYGGTFNSVDVSAWNPTQFYLRSMPAGYAGTFNSADVSAWRPDSFLLTVMPLGYAGTFNSSDLSAWNPSDFRLFTMPTATFTIIITAGGFAAWKIALTVNLSTDNLNQTQIDQILTDFYTAFATRTVAGGTITLNGAGNAAPSGLFQAMCPPTTGKEHAYELLNDSCLINPTKKWATVTTN